MITCTRCGNENVDNARFCDNCGICLESIQSRRAAQSKCLAFLQRRLRAEQIAWRIPAVLCTVTTVICLFILSYIIVIGNFSDRGFMLGLPFLLIVLILAPFTVMHLIMSSRTGGYLKDIEADCLPAVVRATSPGPIIAAVFFNHYAMIFIIINAIFVHRNAEVFKQLKEDQLLQAKE